MSFTIEDFDENKENNSIMLSDKDFSGDSISFSDVKNSTAISDSIEETWGDSSNSLNSSNLQILNGGLDIDFKHRKYKRRRKYEESTTILGNLDELGIHSYFFGYFDNSTVGSPWLKSIKTHLILLGHLILKMFAERFYFV